MMHHESNSQAEHAGHSTNMMQECLRNCMECHQSCTEMVAHCLSMGGEHASAQHIGTLLDCAEACLTSAHFMMRNSPLHQRTCGVCAEACERCADECERMADGDAQMLRCAEICRTCAASCRAMAA